MLNWRTLGFGVTFGILDSIALPITKGVSHGWSRWWMVIPALIYASTPFIFLKALEKETLTIMNLVWDLTSDLIVTLIGLIIFAEVVSPTKLLGVVVSMIGLILMTYEDDSWDAFLMRNYNRARDTFKIW
jgi:multidrug transporter EmrE-like cation transporter